MTMKSSPAAGPQLSFLAVMETCVQKFLPVDCALSSIHVGDSSSFTLLPSSAAALASVVSVRLPSFSSSKRLRAARLVCIRLAKSVLVSCCAFISCAICHAVTDVARLQAVLG